MDHDMGGGEISSALPSTDGIIDMREVLHFDHMHELHTMAYHVAWTELNNLTGKYSPGIQGMEGMEERHKDQEEYSFVKPDDPHHAHYLCKVTDFKTLLQVEIPGLRFEMMSVPIDIVIISDLAAQCVSLEKEPGQVEEWFLAHPEDYVHQCYFLKPRHPYHALYQHRLAEHRRTKLKVRAPIPCVASAPATVPNPTAFSKLSIIAD